MGTMPHVLWRRGRDRGVPDSQSFSGSNFLQSSHAHVASCSGNIGRHRSYASAVHLGGTHRLLGAGAARFCMGSHCGISVHYLAMNCASPHTWDLAAGAAGRGKGGDAEGCPKHSVEGAEDRLLRLPCAPVYPKRGHPPTRPVYVQPCVRPPCHLASLMTSCLPSCETSRRT